MEPESTRRSFLQGGTLAAAGPVAAEAQESEMPSTRERLPSQNLETSQTNLKKVERARAFALARFARTCDPPDQRWW